MDDNDSPQLDRIDHHQNIYWLGTLVVGACNTNIGFRHSAPNGNIPAINQRDTRVRRDVKSLLISLSSSKLNRSSPHNRCQDNTSTGPLSDEA